MTYHDKKVAKKNFLVLDQVITGDFCLILTNISNYECNF